MPYVPKKNISGFLQDIRHPSVPLPARRASGFTRKIIFTAAPVPASGEIKIPTRRRAGILSGAGRGRWVFAAAALAVFAAAGIFAFNIFNLRNNVLASTERIRVYLSDAKTSFFSLNPGAAKNAFFEAGRELEAVRRAAEQYKLFEISGLVGNLAPLFKEIPDFFENISRFNEIAFRISANIEQLMQGGIRNAFNGRGGEIIKAVEELHEDVRALRYIAVALRNKMSLVAKIGDTGIIDELVGEDYLAMDLELLRAEEFLGGLLSILRGAGERHIAVFFQNPSEMRASGGFIGSYADIVIKDGNVVAIDVRDIYDPDGQLDVKIVPPREMQSLTRDWGARDANWFFDFPLSAEKVLYFLEASKMYRERMIAFEGAIALNANVVKDILDAVGPVEIPEYDLVIDGDNFLREIQEEVEAGRDKRVKQPKRILKIITPILIKRLMNLDEAGLANLIASFGERAVKKDIQIYFRDQRLQNFVVRAGMAGEVFQLPQGFFGDYIAVVNSNIAGGKTDIFMEQTIDLLSSVDASGKIRNQLVVTRKHNGQNQPQNWHRVVNQNFVRIFAAPDSKLVSVKGSDAKIVKAQIDYEKAGYRRDPDLQEIEDGADVRSESGKTVFGAWLNVAAGKSKTLELQYEREGVPPADGKVYQFIFEKQSGVNTSFHLSLEAPPGYRWRESDSALFSYRADDPDGRVIINLTLMKIQ